MYRSDSKEVKILIVKNFKGLLTEAAWVFQNKAFFLKHNKDLSDENLLQKYICLYADEFVPPPPKQKSFVNF